MEDGGGRREEGGGRRERESERHSVTAVCRKLTFGVKKQKGRLGGREGRRQTATSMHGRRQGRGSEKG